MGDIEIDIGREADSFTVGRVVVMQSLDGGRTWRTLRGWRLLAFRARQRAHDLTRWWRPRLVVTAIASGIVTLSEERWSWWRWRWERVA